jgi:hypothetical protein
LTGGGNTGPVSLQLDLAHVRSELHLREDSLDNLAIGDEALQATGADAAANIALGGRALQRLTSGGGNTAIGYGTLSRSTVGHTNTAVGTASLAANESGYGNVAVGYNALTTSTGYANIGVGYYAGYFAASGSNNIHLGSTGAETDAQTIRIGGSQTRTFLAGVRGITTGTANAIPVVVDSAGQLGTISSSRRTKTDIADLGDAASRIHGLRPVSFRYKTAFTDGSSPVQYGLIAEEVEGVLPELVAYGADGEPETVMYHVLPTMLLAEVQRLERERADLVRKMEAQERAQAERIGALERSLGELRERLGAGERGDPRERQ